MAPRFDRYVGIDYSGAQTPTSSLDGLRVFVADAASAPTAAAPPPTAKKHWTRRALAQWLVARLRGRERVLVGIDHAFSFPLAYFEKHRLPYDWPAFLDDFQRHWPTDDDHTYVDFVREGECGDGAARSGDSRWRRLTERRVRGPKSVFHFDVPGSVAKSTHAGLPWLRYLRREAGDRVHWWPFDGWDIPDGKSAVVEIYPSLWSREFPCGDRTPDQHDAWTVAACLRRADLDGSLARLLEPSLTAAERETARVEGWILGVS
jgi:hypothetical protein